MMKDSIFNRLRKYSFFTNILFAPLILLCIYFLRIVREIGITYLPLALKIFRKAGIFPLWNHYYEPFFNPDKIAKKRGKQRNLPAIDFNIQEQLAMLKNFSYNDELSKVPIKKTAETDFYHENGRFHYIDAEYFYSIIRHFKPKKIFEIGCGFSTMLAEKALHRNKVEQNSYSYRHLCIEPYRFNFLEGLNLEIIKDVVENISLGLFKELDSGDILFIDSSHVIKPGGDVLYEYLEILPSLKKGTLIHIHDIFTPYDYPYKDDNFVAWFRDEQYMVESFLSYNTHFKIIGALNYLYHNYPDELYNTFYSASYRKDIHPSSLWLRKEI